MEIAKKEPVLKPLSEFQKKYKFLNSIGGGNFGIVNLYRSKKGTDMWAVKEIDTSKASPKYLEYIHNEVRALQNINYNYILKAEEAYQSDKKIMIVTKYAEHGTSFLSFFYNSTT